MLPVVAEVVGVGEPVADGAEQLADSDPALVGEPELGVGNAELLGTRLDHLHELLIAAFGWGDYHMHCFSSGSDGYDLSKGKRRRAGRPSLGRDGASPRVSFRTTPELYRAAKRRAREEGRTVSELARDAVARYVRS